MQISLYKICFSLFTAFFVVVFFHAPLLAAGPYSGARTIVVRGDHGYPPYEFVENGKPTGFNVDLMNEIARVMNLKIDLQLGSWKNVLDDFSAGKVDVLLGLAYSQKRDWAFDFSTPHSKLSMGLFVRKSSHVKSIADLSGKEVVVQEGGIMHDFLKEKRITDRIVPARDTIEILKLLADGNYDAALMNRPQGLYYANKLKIPNIEAFEAGLPPVPYGFAVAEGNDVLLVKLNEGLAILKSTGAYKEIHDKWFGVYETKTVRDAMTRYLLYPFMIIAGLFFVTLAWTWSLRKQVKMRTADFKRSEERYRLLVENASEGVVVVTDNQVSFVNPRALQISGYSREELTGRQLFQLVYPDDQPLVLDYHANVLKREDTVLQYPFRIINKNGDIRWVLNNSAKIEWDRMTGILNIFTDITENKQLESQVLHSQKMEAIGQLAGGIAHDFNNILTAIMGYGNLLKMNIENRETIIKYADNILSSAERAANLTRNLLAFGRRQSCDPRPLNLNSIVLDVESMLSKLIGEDIELSATTSTEDLVVLADSNQIIQVLMNLATNARDAMPRGGMLKISTSRAEIDDDFIKKHGFGIKGLYALISFEDNGIGMDERTLARVFEPFFTTKDVGKGTGLGLATAYGMIKQQNGYIDVQSRVNEGTTFNVYLPVMLSEPVWEAKTESLAPAAGGGETILVGEDEPDIRSFVREVLEEHGYGVVEARDGEEVVSKFNEYKDDISLLILDIIMPKKNGKVAYDEIKNERQDQKVIFVSGYTADIIETKGIADKTINLLQKPVDITTLLTEVRRVLDS